MEGQSILKEFTRAKVLKQKQAKNLVNKKRGPKVASHAGGSRFDFKAPKGDSLSTFEGLRASFNYFNKIDPNYGSL